MKIIASFLIVFCLSIVPLPLLSQTSVLPSNADNPIFFHNSRAMIGSGIPSEKLQVNGNISVLNSTNETFLKVIGSSGRNSRLWIQVPDTSRFGMISWAVGGSQKWQMGYNGKYGNGGWYLFNVSTQKYALLINSTNNYVGIGTTDPQEKLHLEGNFQNSGHIYSTADNSFIAMDDNEPRMGIVKKAGSRPYFAASSGTPFRFMTTSSGTISSVSNTAFNELMRLTPEGNLGIGITSPTYKLDVAGTIRATEIKVEAHTADFVFEPDYQLRSLDEVESFILDNKHLPDIPSASQMEEEGIGLAEMNKLLLQKIEELTLYMIELQKVVCEQEKRQNFFK